MQLTRRQQIIFLLLHVFLVHFNVAPCEYHYVTWASDVGNRLWNTYVCTRALAAAGTCARVVSGRLRTSSACETISVGTRGPCGSTYRVCRPSTGSDRGLEGRCLRRVCALRPRPRTTAGKCGGFPSRPLLSRLLALRNERGRLCCNWEVIISIRKIFIWHLSSFLTHFETFLLILGPGKRQKLC